MLIYEKDNKLNINFENSVDGEPDLQIGKSRDKTEVLIDGQPGSGGSNAPLICTDTAGTLDKTMGEIQTAYISGKNIFVVDGSISFLAVEVEPVFLGKGEYVGGVGVLAGFDSSLRYYGTAGQTEEIALAAYPHI